MEALLAVAIGLLCACGLYLVLRGYTFPVVLGLTLLSYGVNLFLFAMGRLRIGAPAIIEPGRTQIADPLPQALVLTAIVIGFGMTAFVVVLALRARAELGTDQVDGRAEPPGRELPTPSPITELSAAERAADGDSGGPDAGAGGGAASADGERA